jgi:hypothetical protein
VEEISCTENKEKEEKKNVIGATLKLRFILMSPWKNGNDVKLLTTLMKIVFGGWSPEEVAHTTPNSVTLPTH